MPEPLEFLIGKALTERGQSLAVAESCTGGLVMHRLTNVPGSSTYFPGGFVTYAYSAKEKYLGVKAETLTQFGAVSRQTASEMAHGIRAAFTVDYGLAVTGIAGPGGGTPLKPVGLVYIGLVTPAGEQIVEHRWNLDREGNKILSAEAALGLLWSHLVEHAS